MDWMMTLGAADTGILPFLAASAGSINKDILPFLAVGGGLAIALIAVVGSFIQSIVVARAREVSRREIAAYVAEGSMSAEDGEKLLSARGPKSGCRVE